MYADVIKNLNLSMTEEEREVLKSFFSAMEDYCEDIRDDIDVYFVLKDIANNDFADLEKYFNIKLKVIQTKKVTA